MSGVREENQIDEGQEEADELEARARRAGWVPEDEFRGDKSRWVSAEQFLRVAEENLPKLKERNRALDTKVRRLELQNNAIQEGLNELRTMASKTAQREYERARADILAEQAAAVQTGDVASFNRTTEQLQKLDSDKPKEAAIIAPPPPPDMEELKAWVASKPWWNKDMALTQMVTNMHANYMAKHPGVSNMEALAVVEKLLAPEFPEELGKPAPRRRQQPAPEDLEEIDEVQDEPVQRARREVPAAVGGGTFTGASPRRANGKPTKISDLPRDEQPAARKAFEKYKGMMAGMKNPFTEEEYVQNYLNQ